MVNANTVNYTNVNTFNITGFENLVGGSGNDGLLFTNYFTAANVTLANVGALDGFDMTDAAFTGTFRNINSVTGGAGSDSLSGLSAASVWQNHRRDKRHVQQHEHGDFLQH